MDGALARVRGFRVNVGFRVNPTGKHHKRIMVLGLAKEAWHMLKPSNNLFYFIFHLKNP
jgi:hypothetical protein